MSEISQVVLQVDGIHQILPRVLVLVQLLQIRLGDVVDPGEAVTTTHIITRHVAVRRLVDTLVAEAGLLLADLVHGLGQRDVGVVAGGVELVELRVLGHVIAVVEEVDDLEEAVEDQAHAQEAEPKDEPVPVEDGVEHAHGDVDAG